MVVLKGTAESEYIIDWLGVRTRHEYDCTSQASLRAFLASRRVSCAKHEKLLQKVLVSPDEWQSLLVV